MRTSPAHLLPPQLQEARSIIIHILLIRKLRLKEVDRLAADHKQQFFKISHIHGNMLPNFENMFQMTQNNYSQVIKLKGFFLSTLCFSVFPRCSYQMEIIQQIQEYIFLYFPDCLEFIHTALYEIFLKNGEGFRFGCFKRRPFPVD